VPRVGARWRYCAPSRDGRLVVGLCHAGGQWPVGRIEVGEEEPPSPPTRGPADAMPGLCDTPPSIFAAAQGLS
jgi:hypothetical protein